MMQIIGPAEIQSLAPAGHYIALRIGFAFPVEEINSLPLDWVDHYTKNRYMLFDPIIRWAYSSVGALRWSDIPIDDPRRIILQAQTFGLCYGAAISVFD
jgi:LuxR family transcriptional regulator